MTGLLVEERHGEAQDAATVFGDGEMWTKGSGLSTPASVTSCGGIWCWIISPAKEGCRASILKLPSTGAILPTSIQRALDAVSNVTPPDLHKRQVRV